MRRAILTGLILCLALTAQTYTAYRIDTFAGGPVPPSLTGASANLGFFLTLAVNAAGDVYFETGETILRLNLDGTITQIAGNGMFGSDGDGGAATQARIGHQCALAVDGTGAVYLTDSFSSQVRKVSDGIITTVAGGGETLQDGVPATAAQLAGPSGVAVDLQGNLYISDSGNNVIREVSNGVITTIAGTGTAGFSGDGGPALEAQFSNPCSLAIDFAGNLYVADVGNNRIRKVSNGTVSTVAGTGAYAWGGPETGVAASAAIAMFQLSGLTTDAAGDLYIATETSVQKLSGGMISTVAGVYPEVSFYLGDGEPATQVPLLPSGIGLDSAGNLYVGDSLNAAYSTAGSHIRKVSQGIITTIAGGGYALGDSGPATSAQFDNPNGVAVDPAGNVYIADTFDARVRVVSNGIVATIAGTGYAPGSDTGNGGPPLQADLLYPTGVAVDSAGNLWIGDALEAIHRVSNGMIETVVQPVPDSVEDLTPFVIAPDGDIYLSDPASNVVYHVSNGAITPFAGNGKPGYSGDSGPAANAQLYYPSGLALDSSGNLYICDSYNYVIRRVSDGIITTIATGFIQPSWITIDQAGNLYVSDSDTIDKISNGMVTTIAGGGVAQGDGGLATKAQLSAPAGIAVDSGGRIFFSDAYNNRVRVLTPTQFACTYDAGNGFVFSADGDPATLEIQTEPGCAWSLGKLPSWITSSAQTGTGTANLGLTATVNSGTARVGTITVAGIPISIGQYGVNNAMSVLSAADYASGPFAAGSIASIYGFGLAADTMAASGLPLPSLLGGVSASIQGADGVSQSVPLYYVSPGQINFQIPDSTAAGIAILSVSTPSGTTLTSPIQISEVSPGIFTLNTAGLAAATILRVTAAGTQSFEPIYQIANGEVVAKPIDLGPATDQVYLSLYGTGIHNAGTSSISASINNASAWVSWAGAQGSFPGEDQVNVLLPRGLAGSGAIPVFLTAAGQGSSNTVMIDVQ